MERRHYDHRGNRLGSRRRKSSLRDKLWGGIAIGAVIGGGLGDDPPAEAPPGDGNSFGGAKNANSDSDSDDGGQGLFSLWGHEVWLYLGGILGVGDKAGLYLTAGPMIGKNPDFAVGGGIHLAKAFGVGMVIPLRQAYQSWRKHEDKIGGYMDGAKSAIDQVGTYAHVAMDHAKVYADSAVASIPQITQTLEQVLTSV